jgi:hypothetical protein
MRLQPPHAPHPIGFATDYPNLGLRLARLLDFL